MTEKKKQKNSKKASLRHLDRAAMGTSSAADCTGLIPANPQTGEDVAAYKDLYGFEGEAMQERN